MLVAQTIERVWCELLGADRIAANMNFFDAGGDSLLAVMAAEAIAAELSISLSVHDVYGNPTIETLSCRIRTLAERE